MTVKVSVTVTQVREDGTGGPVDGELAAALAGPAGQFSEMLSWTARQACGWITGSGRARSRSPGGSCSGSCWRPPSPSTAPVRNGPGR